MTRPEAIVYLTLFTLVLLCTGSVASATSSVDPWYEDVMHHWAKDLIRVLWEEQVADGFVGLRYVVWQEQPYWVPFSEYRPDTVCTRAELAMLMAKTFGLQQTSGATFADVPESFMAYDTKPAHGWIEAAASQNLVFGTSPGMFEPNSPITREHAVTMLVRALGLKSFADTLTWKEVESQIARFTDGKQVSAELQREMAAAILLQLVRGYPDGTLRPLQHLLRCESATLVARSCLVRVQPSPNVFSPDGDGIEDTTDVFITSLKNRSAIEWGLTIMTTSFHVVKRWHTWFGHWGGTPPEVVRWDGLDQDGGTVGNGLYLCQAWIRDRLAQPFQSAWQPIFIERPALWAFASPRNASPGDTVQVTAFSAAVPEFVFLVDSQCEMHSMGLGWYGTIVVPLDADEGERAATVEARYPSGAIRHASATYTVVDGLSLAAELIPSRAYPGQSVRLVALCSEHVVGVHAMLPWTLDTLEMQRLDGTTWQTQFVIPKAAQEGTYAVLVCASTTAKQKQTSVLLDVDTSPLSVFGISLTQ